MIDKEGNEDYYIMPFDATEYKEIYPFISLTNQSSSVQIYND